MSSEGRVVSEELLDLNQQILRKEFDLSRAKLFQKLFKIGIVLGPVSFVAIYVVTWATYGRFDMMPVNLIAIPLTLATLFACGAYASEVNSPDTRTKSPGEVALELAILIEKKRLKASELALSVKERRTIYREDAVRDIKGLRKESKYYRRIHNLMQSAVIVGSLATTTVSGLAVEQDNLRWASVASSFVVGIAAGFTGYFKFKERGFYLQQTADAIEQEWHAVELGIGRYKRIPKEEEQLAEFVEEVERLKSEQRKREQNLEQPPESRESASS
ncbi:SLATT domain-containing protein [Microbispora sp. H11081]|uniref:SLATT domain-containing protein n=1 Tax=Microbispora sp. H11081 TaxID=2729107 RepID=UPI001B8CDF69|nr:DUF4231 domain-containing protein [Microbispora sp. H11081]